MSEEIEPLLERVALRLAVERIGARIAREVAALFEDAPTDHPALLARFEASPKTTAGLAAYLQNQPPATAFRWENTESMRTRIVEAWSAFWQALAREELQTRHARRVVAGAAEATHPVPAELSEAIACGAAICGQLFGADHRLAAARLSEFLSLVLREHLWLHAAPRSLEKVWVYTAAGSRPLTGWSRRARQVFRKLLRRDPSSLPSAPEVPFPEERYLPSDATLRASALELRQQREAEGERLREILRAWDNFFAETGTARQAWQLRLAEAAEPLEREESLEKSRYELLEAKALQDDLRAAAAELRQLSREL